MKDPALMNDKERAEYYKQRRAAKLAGNEGVLPDGRTVQQAREEYLEKCNNDPFKTMSGIDAARAIAEGHELPTPPVVSTPETYDDPEIENKRCCG